MFVEGAYANEGVRNKGTTMEWGKERGEKKKEMREWIEDHSRGTHQ